MTMAAPGRRAGPGGLARWALAACLGVTGYCVAALFVVHGDAQTFDIGAVITGAGVAVFLGLAGWLARLRWRNAVTVTVFAAWWENFLGLFR